MNKHRELHWIVVGTVWSWMLLGVCVAGYMVTRPPLPTLQFERAELTPTMPDQDTQPVAVQSVIQIAPSVTKTTEVTLELEPRTSLGWPLLTAGPCTGRALA